MPMTIWCKGQEALLRGGIALGKGGGVAKTSLVGKLDYCLLDLNTHTNIHTHRHIVLCD